jgi:hypothetical protein
MSGYNSKTRHGGGSVTVWAAISWYPVGPIITCHDWITARVTWTGRVRNHVHPVILMLFLNNEAPIHTVGTVLAWFGKHDGELPYLPWPAQLPHLNMTERSTLVSLETIVRTRLPSPTSLKQLEDVSSRRSA